MPKDYKTKKLVFNSLLSSFSLLLAIMCHYFPMPFLDVTKLDLSDIPAFVSTLLFGSVDGASILLVVSFIKSFFFSSTGIYGFIMRIVNIIAILLLGIKKLNTKKVSFYFISAIFLPILVKIFLNYVFLTRVYLMPENAVKATILSAILPFNLIKQVVNLVLSFIFAKKMSEYVEK